MNELTAEEETRLRDALKRCPTATIEAAVLYREARDRTLVPLVVMGVIERFVERDLRPKLRSGDLTLRLGEDLAMDSLTMMETVMLLEEVLQITIDSDELRPLQTLGQVHGFVDAKLNEMAEAIATPKAEMTLSGTTDWTTQDKHSAGYLDSSRLGNNAKSAAHD